MSDQVQIENGKVLTGLEHFVRGLADRSQLLRVIAAGMLQSVRLTFREQGSPANSWAPLAPSTLRNKRSKATAGRKILILSGRLQNSIQAVATDDGVEIGTNLVYARPQQEGSADRAGAAIGPQARIPDRAVTVREHKVVRGYIKAVTQRTRKDGKFVIEARRVPVPNTGVTTKEHQRYQNIPPRPFLVFRPDDEPRIEGQVEAFIAGRARRAGLTLEGGA